MDEAPALRWWGWGDEEHASGLSAPALRLLAERLGPLAGPRPPVALQQVRLDPATLKALTVYVHSLGGGK